MPHFDIITFDCYGTLIDWDGGIAASFKDAALVDGVDLHSERVLAVYHEVEPTVQQDEYRSYRDVLADTARRCAARLEWPLLPSKSGFLADSLGAWKPFPDTNPMLEKLRRSGYRLGILSNIDQDLFAMTRRQFTVDFDLVITAQQVRSYKPAHGHFLTARENIGEQRWLHAARSYYHDIVPARALGIPVVWVNRGGDPRDGTVQPDAEVTSLEGLVAWLDGREES
jgi:2-haloacid dehalogenase/putative hydrolase of the HAD superfamily